LALEPFEETADAVPAIVFVIVVGVFAASLFAVDDELLVVLRQFFEGQIDVDFGAGTGAEQILLRFAHFFPAKNPDGALGNRERTIGNGAIQIDRDRTPEASALRARA